MIPDYKIRTWAQMGGVEPYDPARVNPASIDLCWSGKYRMPIATGGVYHLGGDKNDLAQFWSAVARVAQGNYLTIQPGEMYLLDTWEYLRFPPTLCGLLMLKSSSGRAGLEHHHAGFFDPGFEGTATLEITNTAPYPIAIHPGQAIVQMVLFEIDPPARDYSLTGQYGGQKDPTTAGGNR